MQQIHARRVPARKWIYIFTGNRRGRSVCCTVQYAVLGMGRYIDHIATNTSLRPQPILHETVQSRHRDGREAETTKKKKINLFFSLFSPATWKF